MMGERHSNGIQRNSQRVEPTFPTPSGGVCKTCMKYTSNWPWIALLTGFVFLSIIHIFIGTKEIDACPSHPGLCTWHIVVGLGGMAGALAEVVHSSLRHNRLMRGHLRAIFPRSYVVILTGYMIFLTILIPTGTILMTRTSNTDPSLGPARVWKVFNSTIIPMQITNSTITITENQYFNQTNADDDFVTTQPQTKDNKTISAMGMVTELPDNKVIGVSECSTFVIYFSIVANIIQYLSFTVLVILYYAVLCIYADTSRSRKLAKCLTPKLFQCCYGQRRPIFVNRSTGNLAENSGRATTLQDGVASINLPQNRATYSQSNQENCQNIIERDSESKA